MNRKKESDDIDKIIADYLVFRQQNQGRAEATVTKYHGYLRRLIQYSESVKCSPLLLNSDHLEFFTGLYLHGKGLTPKSRNVVTSCVRGFYKWLSATGRIHSNPSAALPLPKYGKKLPVAMDLQHAQKLLMQPGIDTFIGLRDTSIIALFIGCGIRVSGLVGLFESSLIFSQEKGGRERLVIKVCEKGGRERLVPAPDDCWALLRAYLGHPALCGYDRVTDEGQIVLFVNMNNRCVTADKYRGNAVRIKQRSIHHMIVKHGRRCGIPDSQLHPHAMRHLYGAEMAESDVDLLVRQALMGHADPKTTEQYSHLAHRKMREATDLGNPLTRLTTPVTDLVKQLTK